MIQVRKTVDGTGFTALCFDENDEMSFVNGCVDLTYLDALKKLRSRLIVAVAVMGNAVSDIEQMIDKANEDQ
jgi:hypothetical protein